MTKCAHCGAEISGGQIYIREDGEAICSSCQMNHYHACRICGVSIANDKDMCDECRDVVFKKVINSYGTKVTGIFKNKNTSSTKCLNDRYYGYEMEYSNITPAAAKLAFKDMYDKKLLYNKSDSSLSGGGVEIVTIPMTSNHIKSLISDMDFDGFKKMKSSSNRSLHERAGVHIHVSRNTIDPIDVTKLSLLFNSVYSMMYKKFIYYLVGRVDRIGDKNLLDYNMGNSDHYYSIGNVRLKACANSECCASHGLALNLGNKNTIEFRLFKSSADKEQLKSYLEFTERAIDFCHESPIKKINIPNFIVYLSLTATNKWLVRKINNVKKHYPELFEVRDNDYKIDKYLKVVDKMPRDKVADCIAMMGRMPLYRIDWDKDVSYNDIRTVYANYSNGGSNDIIDRLREVIKHRTIKEILSVK